jgi:hypothetical protein
MTTINRLTRTDSVSPGDVLPVFVQNQGDARGAAVSVLQAFMQANLAFPDVGITQFVTQYANPSSTGFSVQVTDGSANVRLIMAPTGPFATGTIVLPAVVNVLDKQEILISCTQAVTALTFNGNGATVTGKPSAFQANDSLRLMFDLPTNTWYQVSLTVQNNFATGIAAFLANPTSANLIAALLDETGTGTAVFANSPTLAGVPLAPTAAIGTNTQQIANMAALQARILGTVSQAAGVPTGTILESGSNANGEYIKYANGTMICTFTVAVQSVAVTTSYSPVFYGLPPLWTFPVAFVGNFPAVELTAYRSGGLVWTTRGGAASLSSAQMAILDGASNTNNFQLSYSAIGRWF